MAKEETTTISGNRTGGLKTAIKNKEKDPDYYRKLGKLGGQRSSDGGFASDKVGSDGLTGRERASIAGKRGGAISRRKPTHKVEVTDKSPHPYQLVDKPGAPGHKTAVPF